MAGPLPSWNDGAAKSAILDFVARVTSESGPDFVPPAERIATFDNMGLHIGRRPILAFGNSDGDLAMLRYCKTGPGARLSLLIHHDDAEREVADDREFRLSPLVEALDKATDYGITVVSMRRDWKVVFTPARQPEHGGGT